MANIVDIQVNGKFLDILKSQQETFFINKRTHKLEDMSTRHASNSKSISIPKTANNMALLTDSIPSLNQGIPNRISYFQCNVLMYGIPVMIDAQLVVIGESIDARTFDIHVFGGEFDFFNQLSDEPISNLYWSDFNIEWSQSNLLNYMNQISGLIFASSVWSDNASYTKSLQQGANELDDSLSLMDVNYSGGFLYVKTVLQRILESMTDIKVDTSALDNNTLLQNMVIGLPITQSYDNFNAVDSIEGDVSALETTESFPSDFSPLVLTFPIVDVDRPAGLWNSITNEFVVPAGESGYYDISFKGAFATEGLIDPRFGAVGLRMMLLRGSELTTIEYGVADYRTGYPNWTRTRLLEGGDKLYMTLELLFNDEIDVLFAKYSGSFSVISSGTTKKTNIDLSDWMPDISQRDFVKEIFNFFHITMEENDNVLQFSEWDDIPDSIPINLNEYLVKGGSMSLNNYLGSHAQSNIFQWDKHETVEIFGTDYSIETLNDNLATDKIMIQSKFTPSDTAQNEIGEERVSIPLFPYVYNKEDNNKINSSGSNTLTYRTNDANNLKVSDVIIVDVGGSIQRRRVVSVTDNKNGFIDVAWVGSLNEQDWRHISYETQDVGMTIGLLEDGVCQGLLEGGNSVVGVGADQKRAVFSEDLHWDSLVKNYYSNFEAMMEKPLIMTATFKIPASLFTKLNLKRTVYIDGTVWYINEIEKYKSSEFCKMQLIKVKQK